MAHRSDHPGIIKLACVQEGQLPYLFEFDQSEPLENIVGNVCMKWKIEHPEQYAFKTEDKDVYVTQDNRLELKNGDLLKLDKTPDASAAELVEALSRGSDRKSALAQLQAATRDISVARRVIALNVDQILRDAINQSIGGAQPETLSLALGSFTALLQHSLIDPDSIEEAFIGQVMTLVNQALGPGAAAAKKGGGKGGDKQGQALYSCLCILAEYVERCSRGFALIAGNVQLGAVVGQIQQKGDRATQQGALTLMNRLLMRAPTVERRDSVYAALDNDAVFDALFDAVTRVRPELDSFAHELAVFQRLWLNRLEPNIRANYIEANHKRLFTTLRENLELGGGGPGATTASRRISAAAVLKGNKMLGFTDPANPQFDFLAPPGVLALENMVYFARNQQTRYALLVADAAARPEDSAMPFVQTSLAVTSLLLQILHVGTPPTAEDNAYLPVLFNKRAGFSQLFCVTIELAYKTWREMDASRGDAAKVLKVVSKQLELIMSLSIKRRASRVTENPGALKLPDHAPADIGSFTQALHAIPFDDILRAEEEEREEVNENQLATKPVVATTKEIEEEMRELVRRQRLEAMTRGAWFSVPSKGKVLKNTSFFAALSANHNTLHWGNAVERGSFEEIGPPPSVNELEHSFLTEDIKQLFTVDDLPSLHDGKRYSEKVEDRLKPLIFGFLGSNMPETMEFAALNETTAAVWKDGIRGLMDEEMKEKATKDIVDSLTSVQLLLRRLRLGGVVLPTQRPRLPQLPDDLEYAYTIPSDGTNA